MTAYVMAHLRRAPIHAEVLEYMERIEATLAPYGGRFIVHGGTVEVLGGDWRVEPDHDSSQMAADLRRQ